MGLHGTVEGRYQRHRARRKDLPEYGGNTGLAKGGSGDVLTGITARAARAEISPV
jgi:hypothetical protein